MFAMLHTVRYTARCQDRHQQRESCTGGCISDAKLVAIPVKFPLREPGERTLNYLLFVYPETEPVVFNRHFLLGGTAGHQTSLHKTLCNSRVCSLVAMPTVVLQQLT